MKTRLLMFMVATILSLSCSKKQASVVIDEKNLTNCEDNGTCKYLFTEKTDLNVEYFSIKSGNYRVFVMENIKGPSTTKLFIKAPMDSQYFSLNDQDILNGQVSYHQICPSCDYIAFKPVGGSVKGKNLTPEKPANQSKWLIEANILMEAINNPTVKHTVYVKQYFTPNF